MQQDIVTQLPRLDKLSGDVKNLLEGLLNKDPRRRLGSTNGIADIKSHPYFSDIDWAKVVKKKYRYMKLQFLKMDMAQSNFTSEFTDADVGINVEEEIDNQDHKKVTKKNKPLILDLNDLRRKLLR